jgi:hypothetical protein
MRITKGMPLEPGGTVETHGALLDLADFQDDDETGVKVTISQERVRVKVDSYSAYGSSIWLRADDAEQFGQLLIARAAECRKAATS